MKICPACNTKYPDDANFCPMDATRLPAPTAAEKAAAPQGGQGAKTAGAGGSDGGLATTTRDATRSVANRFLLGEKIGHTPTGDLFKATDGTTNEAVRLKIVDQKALPTAMMADRALREFKQLAKVKSERIVRVVDQGRVEDQRVYVATEDLAGPSLEEVVEKEGALSFERAKQIVLSVGEALTEAQKVGVIHRDVSPRNVYLVGDKAKLGEFGVAEPVTDKVYGTPQFLSPEQAEGKPVDQRSNIYSLGALLYYVLTGAPPFEGEREAVIQQHLNSAPKPPSEKRKGITPEIDKLVLKALEKSGGRRHLTLRQLLNEVDALAAPSSLAPASPKKAAPAISDADAGRSTEQMDAVAMGAATIQMPTILDTPSPVEKKPAAPAQPSVVVTPTPDKRASGNHAAKAPSSPAPVAAKAPEPAPSSVVVAPAPEAKPAPSALQSAPTPANVPAASKNGQVAAKPAAAPAPAARAPAAATAKASPGAKAAGKKGGFRETGWFKKGELEEEFAKKAAEMQKDDPLAGPSMTEPVVDESSITAEDRARLSLSTGHTQAMPVIKAVALPGEKMSDEDLLAEVDSSKKWMVIAGIAVGVLALAVAVYFFAIR